jgi:hypothetical protein
VIAQDHFTVVAAIVPDRVPRLRALLGEMNLGPGRVDPHNRLLPFARFEALHMARWVILTDDTLGDLVAHDGQKPALPTYLVFLGDCDGPAEDQLAEFAKLAGDGLRKVFAHCLGFEGTGDLLAWLKAHDVPVGANYVNWRGRTVRQVLEEHSLAVALGERARAEFDAATANGGLPTDRRSPDLHALRGRLVAFVEAERLAGRLELTPVPPTPWGWWLRNAAHALTIPLVGLLLLPLLLLASPFLAWQLRRLETTDPEIAPRPNPAHVRQLAAIEDHDVTNPFSALGSVKAGAFRGIAVTALVALLDYACRHLYHRGHLARVQTIHFARWVFLDGRQRLFFASNYDGSLESYMDDFINKVAWGLNLVFSNGVGYPRTSWLVKAGARNAQAFKQYLRRHQLPTEVWYKAYPGLSAFDLARHSRIREGLEATSLSEAGLRDWLRLL